jgi:hypothetical protein
MNRIDFYYWGDQCPHNSKMKNLLELLINEERYKINLFDISNDIDTARELNIFSPTLLVIDDSLRLHGPISKEKIEQICRGDVPKAKQYKVNIGTNVIKAELKNNTEVSIFDSCKLCASSTESIHCSDKGKWIENIRLKFNLPHLGKLHYLNSNCIGGAEFVPSIIVPYPIPRADDIAFLTCSFGSSEEADYKSFPLKKLEEELPKLGYKALMAIASEDSCFPNGPIEWFLDRNYIDLGELYYEEMHFAKMHLVKKIL